MHSEKTIAVLLVEDNPADAELLIRSLSDSALGAFHVIQVTRLDAAVEVLANAAVDVIVLDLSLPDSTGLETVDRLQAVVSHVPIVVITGLEDEALALKAVSRGVQDYLVKGKCEGGLAGRALQYAVERQRIETALHESEERFHALADASFDPVILHEGYRIIEVNKAFERMFGYTAEEVVGRDAVKVLLVPESLQSLSERVRANGDGAYEACLRRKDGSTLLAEVRTKRVVYRGRSIRVASAHDITETRRVDEALRAAERQLRAITDAVPALIAYVDRDGVYRLNNHGYEVWHGIAREQVRGRHVREVMGEAVWQRLRPYMERALAGEEVRFEDRFVYPRVGARWVTVSYTPVRDADGAVQGVVVLATDISQRKAAEDALRESEERFRTLADGAPVLIWMSGLDGVEFVNRTTMEFVGVPDATTLLGHGWMDYLHPDDRDAYVEKYHDCIARRDLFEGQFRYRYHDGTYHWMTTLGRPRFNAAGEFLGYIGSTIDITGIKRAEDALRDREARLRAVVDTALDSIITIDEHGTIDSANPATERLFGYKVAELLGRNVNILMPQPYRGEHDRYISRYLRTGQARIIGIGREVVGLRKGGGTFPLDLSVSEFQLEGRRMFTGILHDISERRRLERAILEASANEQRRVGHELHDGLCQQLAGVAYSVEILARKLGAAAPEAMPAVDKVAEEIDQAITQARTLARGLNPVEIHADSLPVALKDLARKVSEMFQVACEFHQEGNPHFDDSTTATHLYRIAQEAISNAVRHGKAKHVELSLLVGPDISLSIRDDGMGFGNGAPSSPPHAPEKESDGIGMQTMAYRAKLINGVLDIRPNGPRGVAVTCSIPIARLASQA